MEINVLKKDKKELEFEIGGGEDTTLAELIVYHLNQTADVDFAAYKVEHPLVSCPRIYVRTKKGDPVTAIGKALEGLRKDVSGFRESISKLKA